MYLLVSPIRLIASGAFNKRQLLSSFSLMLSDLLLPRCLFPDEAKRAAASSAAVQCACRCCWWWRCTVFSSYSHESWVLPHRGKWVRTSERQSLHTTVYIIHRACLCMKDWHDKCVLSPATAERHWVNLLYFIKSCCRRTAEVIYQRKGSRCSEAVSRAQVA